jgi:hypothetical protein
MKIKTLVLSVATAATSAGLLLGPASVASAVPGPPMPNSSYGFDGNAHLIVGGGSITVYKIAQGFADIWNGSTGCLTNNGTFGAALTPQTYPQTGVGAFNQCTPAGGTQTYNSVNAGGNFQGDTVAVATSVGSSTGIATLNGFGGGAAGNYAYEGTNASLPTLGDPNALKVPTYGVARTDSAGLTNGLPTFTDASAVATDVGQPVTGTGIPANTTVVSVVGTTVTMSANFTGTTGTVSVTFPNAVDAQPPGNQLSNGYGTPDFAISSRGPRLGANTTKGNCALAGNGGANDELACDTFWGVAADGVQVFTFDTSDGIFPAAGLTAADLFNIWECNITTWGQLPEYSTLTNPPPSNAPIVPWAMNTGSGTYADFNSYVTANAGLGAFTADDKKGTYGPTSSQNPTPTVAGQCDREFSVGGGLPQENDVKPLLLDVEQNYNGGAGITTTNALSTNNPANWIWFGSNGLMNNYTYLSQPNLFSTQFNTAEVDLAGIKPTSLTIGGNATGTIHATYPAQRTLSIVTKKGDADCPVPAAAGCNFADTHTDSVTLNGTATFADASATGADVGVEVTSGAAGFPAPATVLSVSGGNVTISSPTVFSGATTVTFANGPFDGNGTTNLNVLGPTGGKAGGIREFVRMLCSTSAEDTALDPYTGNSLVSEVGAVIAASGFTLPPIHSNESTTFNRTPNSDCDVQAES